MESILADLAADKSAEDAARKTMAKGFKHWLTDRMAERKMSPSMLSDRLGCSETNIYRILRAGNTTTKTVTRVARALGFKARLVFEPDEAMA